MKPIKNDEDLAAALARIDDLMNRASPNTPLGDELEVLTILVEKYESEHEPISAADPIDAIKFRLEQRGMRPYDLIPMVGSSGRVSEVLSRKRSLTLAMIRKLSAGLGIPTDVLVGGMPPQPSQVAETRKKYRG